jgi:hypothetical protein
VADADVYLGDSVVRDTRERPDGLFGDGLIVYDVDVAGVLGLERSSVAGNVRGGVVSFGGFANVATSSFQCNGLQLVVDSYEGALGEVLDLGDNVCGCGDQTEPCKVTSTSLEPPEALAD